jgi:lipopolysaccharide heptosyltransferase II
MLCDFLRHTSRLIVKNIDYTQKRRRAAFFHNTIGVIDIRRIRNIMLFVSMGIGDLILFTPTISALRKALPIARITLLIDLRNGCEEVLRGSELVDEILYLPSREASIFEKMAFLKEMRRRNFELLINCFWADKYYLVLLAIICCIPYRAGFVSNDEWEGKYDFLYNIKIKMQRENEIDRGLRFAYALGIEKTLCSRQPIVYLEEKDRLYAEQFYRENKIDDHELIVGIQLGSAPHQKWKRWGLEKHIRLCNRLIGLNDVKIIVLGSKDELALANRLSKSLVDREKIVVAIGSTTVKQAAAIIAKCSLCICHDSSLSHICAAMKIPVVAIYGPTDPVRTASFGNEHLIVRKKMECSPCFRPGRVSSVENCQYNYQCLTSVSVDDVIKTVNKVIPIFCK